MTDRAKHATSYRLTPEVKRLIAKLAKALGVTRAAIIELAVREKADRDGVK